MIGWQKTKLGNLISIKGGFSYKGKYIGFGDNLLLGMGCVSNKETFLHSGARAYSGECSEEYIVKPGDIVLATRQQSDNLPILGLPAIIPFNYDDKRLIAGTNLYLVKNNSDVDNRFLYWLLKSSSYRNHISSCAKGTTVRMITKDAVESYEFLCPHQSDRDKISNILWNIEYKIDLLRRQNKTLEQLAETLFRQELNSNSDWIEKPLSTLIETTLGGEWGKDNPEGEYQMEVCCIRGTDIADLQTGIAEKAPIRYVKEKKFYSIQPVNGDLILEISGGTEDQSTGRTIYINELNRTLFPNPIVFSNFCRLLRPKKEDYSYFLYLYIQYLYKNDEFFNLENGSSGIKNLDYKYLINDLKFKLPVNENDILDFNKSVSIYFEKINKNKHQILILNKLRDALLPRLMSGDIKIK